MAHPLGVDPVVWRQHAWRNRLQSAAILAVMAGFLALVGRLLWGPEGVLVLLPVGLSGMLLSPTFSPWLVMRMYGAMPLGQHQLPALWSAVSELSRRAGLPRPPLLYYLPSRILNSFAVGSRQRSAIAVSDGLLRGLEMRELVGVLAHEISHIRNNDLWALGLADTFSRATALFSLAGQFLLVLNLPLIMLTGSQISWSAILLLILAPNLSALAQLALSRTREYDADLNAALLTGDPEGLASALAKLERVQGGWLERMLLPGRRVPEPSLLRTHPPTAERIARLLALKPRLARFPHDGPWVEWDLNVDAGFPTPVTRRPGWHASGLWH